MVTRIFLNEIVTLNQIVSPINVPPLVVIPGGAPGGGGSSGGGGGSSGPPINPNTVRAGDLGALHFRGVNEAMVGGPTMSSILNGSTSYLVSIWIKPSYAFVPSTTLRNVVSSWVSGSLSTFSIGIDMSTRTLSARATNNAFEQNGTSPRFEVNSPPIDFEVWTHVAFYVDQTTLSLFINGTRVDTRSDKTVYVVSNRPTFLGASGGGVYQGLNVGPYCGFYRDYAILSNIADDEAVISSLLIDSSGGIESRPNPNLIADAGSSLESYFIFGSTDLPEEQSTAITAVPTIGSGSMLGSGLFGGPYLEPVMAWEYSDEPLSGTHSMSNIAVRLANTAVQAAVVNPQQYLGTSPTSYSIGIWVNPDTFGQTRNIVGQWDSNTLSQWSISMDAGGLVTARAANHPTNDALATPRFITSTNALTAGQWQHVGIYVDAGELVLFIDGTEEASTTMDDFTIKTSTIRIRLGGGTGDHQGSSPSTGFVGMVRDFTACINVPRSDAMSVLLTEFNGQPLPNHPQEAVSRLGAPGAACRIWSRLGPPNKNPALLPSAVGSSIFDFSGSGATLEPTGFPGVIP